MARDASLRVGIVGAAGYTGAELVRLVHGHPNLALSYVAARERAGQKLDQAVPSTAGIEGLGELVLETFDVARASELSRCCDVMFLGLPHEASASAAEALLAAGLVVVDLSAAFRLKDPLAYEPWYGISRRRPKGPGLTRWRARTAIRPKSSRSSHESPAHLCAFS